MNLIKKLLMLLGIIPKKTLIETMSTKELYKLGQEATKYMAENLKSKLAEFKTIDENKIQHIVEIGSFISGSEKIKEFYENINNNEYNSLKFDEKREFIPTADYLVVYYLQMKDNRQFVFVYSNKYDYSVEPRIEDLFEIPEGYILDLSK